MRTGSRGPQHPWRDGGGRSAGGGVRWGGIILASALWSGGNGWPADTNGFEEIHPPIGPYVHPQPADFATATSFTTQDRVVLTPYFYWYDVYSGAHLKD